MKNFIVTFCLSILCLPVMSQQVNPVQEAMANYDYEKALALIGQDPSPTLALLYQKGRALKSLGQNARALEVFQDIATRDTLNPRVYIEMGECCKSLTKYVQALQCYRKSLDLNPDNKYVRIQYINMLINCQQYQEALGESSLMTETDSSAVVLHLQAQCFERLEQPAFATGCYHVIQQKYPADYLAAAKLGALYIAAHYYDYAIEATERYRQIDTTNIYVNRQNAQAYCLNKDYLKAIERYTQLMAEGDSTFQTCYYLGVSYYATTKNYFEAHDMLEMARKYDPQNVNLLYYLGRACSRSSWKEQGVMYLEDAINFVTPTDSVMSRLYGGLASCYGENHQYLKQIEAMNIRYQKFDKTHHKLLYDIAYIYYYYLKDVGNTERYLKVFLKTRPKNLQEKPEVDEDGNVILSMATYYNSAADWLNSVQTKKIEDEFFRGKKE
ncbi:MAG: tetratricopeptide repeat protein [Prevotellaceae bacterium]|jgi:tetratricopeptide (TPR) repeat protein|nr:tetratricopeptide repeat protein [Prevotellaceae bacterium]